MKWVKLFADNLAADYQGELPSDRILDTKLHQIDSAARERWPDVTLAKSEFLSYLAVRVSGKSVFLQDVENMHTNDLFLCAACLQGDQAAQKHLLDLTLPLVRMSLAQTNASGSLADEVHQRLLERLISPGANKKPRLALYNGKSKLISWLRVIVIRTILDIQQSLHRLNKQDDGLLMVLVSDHNQELGYFKTLYKSEFKKAFHQALASLTEQEKDLLSYQFIDQLTLEKMSEIYQVNRSTICRRLKQVRDKLQLSTRQAMMEHLKINSDEFESIMGLISSHLDASLCRVLEEDVPGNQF